MDRMWSLKEERINLKILPQRAVKRGLPFTELRKTEGRTALLRLYKELHLGQIKFQVLLQMKIAKGIGVRSLTLK